MISPAPWKWTEGKYGGFNLLDTNGKVVLDDGSAGGEYDQKLDPDGDNGRLVAAAPEMLDALESLYFYFNRPDMSKKPGTMLGMIQSVIRRAKTVPPTSPEITDSSKSQNSSMMETK